MLFSILQGTPADSTTGKGQGHNSGGSHSKDGWDPGFIQWTVSINL